MEPRSLLSGSSQARRTPSSQICCRAEAGGGVVFGGDADVEAYFEEDGDDAGVLADGTVALGAHAGVDEDLGDGVPGGVGLLERVGAGQVGDVVDRVEEADVLEGGGDGFDEVGLRDGGHGVSFYAIWRSRSSGSLREFAVGETAQCRSWFPVSLSAQSPDQAYGESGIPRFPGPAG